MFDSLVAKRCVQLFIYAQAHHATLSYGKKDISTVYVPASLVIAGVFSYKCSVVVFLFSPCTLVSFGLPKLCTVLW